MTKIKCLDGKLYVSAISGNSDDFISLQVMWGEFIGKPEILFADEPTGSLASKTGAEIMTLLWEINQSINQTIIMVTHFPEAERSSSRIITVQDGAIL